MLNFEPLKKMIKTYKILRTKSYSKLLFQLAGELIINILIVPIFSPLFWLDFGWNVLIVVCYINKKVPSSSNYSKSSSSSSKSLRTSGSFCTYFFFCYYLAGTSLFSAGFAVFDIEI